MLLAIRLCSWIRVNPQNLFQISQVDREVCQPLFLSTAVLDCKLKESIGDLMFLALISPLDIDQCFRRLVLDHSAVSAAIMEAPRSAEKGLKTGPRTLP